MSMRAPLCEKLESRFLCKITVNGEFIITPPGGGEGYSTIHQHPQQGVIGLRTAEAQSGGPNGPVVNWEVTSMHEWIPGQKGGPRG